MPKTATTADIRRDVVLPLSAERAVARIHALLRSAACADPPPSTQSLRLSARPARTNAGAQALRPAVAFRLHWEPISVAAAAYPALEAELVVTPLDAATSRLSVLAHYAASYQEDSAAGEASLYAAATRIVQSVLDHVATALREPRADSGRRGCRDDLP